MNTPKTYNFSLFYRGDGVRSFRLLLFSDAGQTIPIDLTGCTVKMELKQGTKTFFTYGTGLALTPVTAPIVINVNEIIFPEIKSWKIPAYGYDYDLQITYPDGFVKTLIRGKIPLQQDITDG